MRQLVTGEQMKAVDQYAIQEVGIPSLVLMERAALSVVEEMEPELFREDQILIACGITERTERPSGVCFFSGATM
mgnify:CR=1 FL=1